MTLKNHRKHSDLKRPAYGNYHVNEWAITGAPCSIIQELAGRIIHFMNGKLKIAYVDAKHEEEGSTSQPGTLQHGAVSQLISHRDFHEVSVAKTPNAFEYRALFSTADLVLVNGNHHQAKAQILIIDERKKASVEKRINQLNNVRLILTTDAQAAIYDFVKEAIPGWQNIPVYNLDDTEKIAAFLKEQVGLSRSSVNGLVLAGGKSMRMGEDKSNLKWHGKEQKYYLADQLAHYCDQVFISCRAEQVTEIENTYKPLADVFIGLGPYGAILSAFQQDPDKAWLVVACDLPMLTAQTLQLLIDKRNISALATTFESSFDGMPEPLITIWEPKSYPVLLSFLSQGYSCPRKVLLNNEIELLKAPNDNELMNVNTAEEAEQARKMLLGKNKEADVT